VYVIVAGGGQVGYHLAKLLQGSGHEVLVSENERTRHLELAREMGENVMFGDGSDAAVLRRAGANRAEVVVSCTGADEDNLITCQMAKYLFMVGRTIARVNDPGNEELFRSLGVDGTINSTRLIDALIEREVDSEMLIPLLSLGGGKLEIVQMEIDDDSPALKKLLKMLPLPKDCLIVSVVRAGEPSLPSAMTVLEPGDTVVALVSPDSAEDLRQLLAA